MSQQPARDREAERQSRGGAALAEQHASDSESESSPPRRAAAPAARARRVRDEDGDEQLEQGDDEGDEQQQEAEEEDGEDGEAEDEEEDDDDESGAANAAQIFSHILRQIGGESLPAGVGVTRDNIQAILRGLAERGLLQQDEEGNLVMYAAPGDDDEDGDEDIAEEGEQDDDDGQEEEDEGASAASSGRGSPLADPPRDTAALAEYAQRAHLSQRPPNVLRTLARMERSAPVHPQSDLAALVAQHIPATCSAVEHFEGRAYAGKFSHSSAGSSGAGGSGAGGSMFACATQDGTVHLYDVDSWRLVKRISARDCGWSLVDLDFSADARFVAYSSWSRAVHLANTTGNYELHESLDFQPARAHRTCMFGIRFSPNESREILAGMNDGVCMLYDIERKRRIWAAQAHDDDINSVCWLDHNLFATGSDDASLRIWDRRLLSAGGSGSSDAAGDDAQSEARGAYGAAYSVAQPVGGFLGHVHGLTSVAAHPDGSARYVLSNAKESAAKLWDLRRMQPSSTVTRETERLAHMRGGADYRWQRLSRRDARGEVGRQLRELDTSVATFTGHIVAQTLVRADFSPLHSTGARFVLSGSADGAIVVWDVLSGEEVRRIEGHQSIVRDVSWNEGGIIVSSSWDHTIRRWAPFKESGLADNSASDSARARARRERRTGAGLAMGGEGRREAALLGLHSDDDDED